MEFCREHGKDQQSGDGPNEDEEVVEYVGGEGLRGSPGGDGEGDGGG